MLTVVVPVPEHANATVAMSAATAAHSLVFAIFIVFFAFIAGQKMIVMDSTDVHFGLGCGWYGALVSTDTNELVVVVLAVSIVHLATIMDVLVHLVILVSVVLGLRVVTVGVLIVAFGQLPVATIDIVPTRCTQSELLVALSATGTTSGSWLDRGTPTALHAWDT